VTVTVVAGCVIVNGWVTVFARAAQTRVFATFTHCPLLKRDRVAENRGGSSTSEEEQDTDLEGCRLTN
jgi:hypothetical protein